MESPILTSWTDPMGRPGVSISDPIESTRFALITDRPVDVTATSTSTDDWLFPVESAASVTAGQVRVPKRSGIFVRPLDDAATINSFQPDGDGVSVDGRRLLEVNTAPVKLYLRAGPCEIRLSDDGGETVLDFDDVVDVQIGVRSYRDQPVGTIKVPDDPSAVMDGVSLFGSALQTTSPERSWPTLRGHPPLIERGPVFDALPGHYSNSCHAQPSPVVATGSTSFTPRRDPLAKRRCPA